MLRNGKSLVTCPPLTLVAAGRLVSCCFPEPWCSFLGIVGKAENLRAYFSVKFQKLVWLTDLCPSLVSQKKKPYFSASQRHTSIPAQNRTTHCSFTEFRRRIHHPPYVFYPAKISKKMNSKDQLPGWNEGTRNFTGSKRLFNKETKYYYKNEEEIMKSLIEDFKYPYSLKQNVQNILSCLFSATRY